MKPWMGNVFLVVGGAALGILLVEGGLRMFGFSAPNFYRSDFDTGATLRAGIEGWWKKEGEAYVKINSEGLRDREHAKAKPPHTLRIAVLGDSYAEAMQVPAEDTFWAVLERELQTCQALHGRPVEVINFGVAGYGTAQELLTLRHRVWDYSPDVVLLAFVSGNDLRNNVQFLEQDPTRPYFVYQDNTLVLDDAFKKYSGWRFRHLIMGYGGYWLIDHLRVFQLLNEARHLLKSRFKQASRNKLALELTQKGDMLELQQNEEGLDTMVYIEPMNQVWKEAWRVTEGLILQMRNEVREKGAYFLVVSLTNGDQVHPDPKQRHVTANQLGVSDLLYPERRLKSLGDRQGFAVLNLSQPFADYAEKHNMYLHGFKNGGGHWNSKGHHLAGTLIAEKVCLDSITILR